jgi:transposase-like protein/molybdenum-dependent DNA-binding transcriptional regulator ModE
VGESIEPERAVARPCGGMRSEVRGGDPGQRAAEHLRARIVAAPKQGPGKRRYGAELKRAVVEYAFAREGERATIREIAEELGLAAGVLGRWLRHARLRLKKGKIPFEPGEPPSMLDPQGLVAESSTASSSSSEATVRRPALSRGKTRHQATAPQRIVIPATTLAEFLAGAVASHGSIRRAADGIGVPYSTLRGWLQGRGGDGSAHGNAFLDTLTALRADLNATQQHLTALLGDINAMRQRLDALERMLGFESDARKQA